MMSSEFRYTFEDVTSHNGVGRSSNSKLKVEEDLTRMALIPLDGNEGFHKPRSLVDLLST